MPMECGRGPDGGFFCRWRISFTENGFNWQFSDVAATGTYTCNGSTITGQLPGGRVIAGQYDAASDSVIWDGAKYLPQ
jgi:hypothetical protein